MRSNEAINIYKERDKMGIFDQVRINLDEGNGKRLVDFTGKRKWGKIEPAPVAVKGHRPDSHIMRILAVLRANGRATNRELNDIAFRYTARIDELRAEGHIIETHQIKKGLFEFIYRGYEPR